MTKKDFIEKVEKQRCWIDMIDVYYLIYFFTEEFGVVYTEFSIEDELIWMWDKINEVKKTKKVCNKCLIEKDFSEFNYRALSKDNRSYTCKVCTRLYYDKYKKNKISI